jgi:hypothetical protein
MIAPASSGQRRRVEMVRLVYHYRDGHDFTTETMLRSEAVVYMPLLRAIRVDAEHFEAAFATIELCAVPELTTSSPARP